MNQSNINIQIPTQLSPTLLVQTLAIVILLSSLINSFSSGNGLIYIGTNIAVLSLKMSYIGAVIGSIGLFFTKRWAVYLLLMIYPILIITPITVGVVQIGMILFRLLMIGIVFLIQKYTT